MISAFDAIRAISKVRDDALAVTTCTPAQYWSAVSDRSDLDVQLPGTMGKASSLALGMALAMPDKKLVVLDGDGSILMNLGSLVTVSGQAPSNLIHFVFEDGEYFTTGAQPIPAANIVGLGAIAKSSGYKASYEFDDLEDFVSQLSDIMNQQGPVFVCLKVDHPEEAPPYIRGQMLKPRDW